MAAVYIKSALFLAIALSLIMGSIADDDDFLSKVTRVQLDGRVVCSPTGNPVRGLTPVGAANVTVTLTCGDDDDDDDDDDNDDSSVTQFVVTNSSGFFSFPNLTSLLFDDDDDCTVKVPLPLPNCTTSLQTGTLGAVPRLTGIVGSTSNLTANFITGLFKLLTGDDED